MEIETRRFGRIMIEEEKIIHMPHGILGFNDKMDYVILQNHEIDPFCLLQSVDEPMLAFFVVNPHLFMPDYQVNAADIFRVMPWQTDQDALSYFVIVTIPPEGVAKMTANLMGPVIVNNNTKEAIQLVLQNSPYSHQHPVFD